MGHPNRPAICPVHGARTQDGYYAATPPYCNQTVRHDDGIPILCGREVELLPEFADAGAEMILRRGGPR